MRCPIGVRTAANALLVLLGALAAFHVLMLSGALPTDVAWGGRAAGDAGDIMLLEWVALFVTVLFAVIVVVRVGYIVALPLRRTAVVAMWLVCVYFALNIVGNMLSLSGVERAIFTPVSALAAVLSLRVALSRAGEGRTRSE